MKQEREPARTEITEVAPGVLRLQLPVRMPGLGHVNTYLFEDKRGASVIDPGMPGPGNWRALRTRLHDAGFRVRDVHTVIVTHSHPDHYGAAARLAKVAGAELVAHETFQSWLADPGPCIDGDHDHDESPDPDERCTASRNGAHMGPPWSQPMPWSSQKGWGAFARTSTVRAFQPLMRRFGPPVPTRRLHTGEVITLANREWIARHTPGHTPDHLCLHDPTEHVLISGDHVLPTITPHIAGVGGGPSPMAAFLRSLDEIAELQSVKTVLPAHGHPFHNLVERVEAIRRHHEEHFETLRAASEKLGWSTVTDLSHELFAQRNWGFMAESETYAHLEHLRLEGKAEREREPGTGKLRYLITAA
ncbi:MAG: MBL fold metallo-hydrolase [Actinobacteria bacterium]|nr:MBL fold metallo-hydrolase [Actinomycetota bacterium]